MSTDIDREWWKEAVVYQIYPRSFADSDGDGIGDLRGVHERVDYLDELGVDVVWLCPVYDSPNADMGYDIRDYRAIMDEMGTMADWERLRDALHDRGMRIVMDLVVNHTSDEHAWFRESRDPSGGRDDWYIWRDGDPTEPPNNWISLFGGPAWTYDEARGAWYLHLFDEKQPDLNWENPAVREAVYDMMNFWLEKGIDGFRMDAISCISKPDGLPDADAGDDWFDMDLYFNGPRIHEFMREMAAETYGDYDVLLIGETPGADPEEAKKYYEDGVDVVVHFDHMDVTYGPGGKWSPDYVGTEALATTDDADLDAMLNEMDLADLQEAIRYWDEGVGDWWNCLYMGSHDQTRLVSRFGDDDEYRRESGKLLATFLLTQQATPFLYQGDEIGMTNADWDSPEDIRDVEARGQVDRLLSEHGVPYETVAPFVRNRSRDNARTPMQWDDSEHAGFTDGDPWIQVNDDYPLVNADRAVADSDSVYHYYRDLIALREARDVLVYGETEYVLPDESHPDVWAHRRTLGSASMLVVLNWQRERERLGDVLDADGRVVFGNYDDRNASATTLAPYEARIYDRSR
ncbi:alpha-glucosidase [Halomicroarcula limicola]|uniref:Alpha-glucosidase n=1 Tax=Haloarcula limicola TaxID=1429915 RepID=A0A8J7Y936_9EURY|nr:alpha-glucosidase [Halomicroarcula limicola]MBV0923001.1 alpha-glucosidase [Halomicroarcula limicola]